MITKLNQLSSQNIKKEIKVIQNMKFSENLEKWIRQYNNEIGVRNIFFWKFISKIYQTINPFKIPNQYKRFLNETKTLITMFIILVDDMVDGRNQNKDVIDILCRTPFEKKYCKNCKLTFQEKKILTFGRNLWKEIEKRVNSLPYFNNFSDIFNYDVAQTMNAMMYSYLINQNPYIVNKKEHWLYSPHTLQGMINSSLDLMCVSKFPLKKIGKVREIFNIAQKTGRIVNCLSTAKSEFSENDLTNTLFVYLIDLGFLKFDDFLKKNKQNIIKEIENPRLKAQLSKDLKNYHREIAYLCNKINIHNFQKFPDQMKKIYSFYLFLGKHTK